jgi:[acyl-carrier-protein] S-malonyltransferase
VSGSATRIAFLFPGQGSQKVGMGSDLLAARPELFDRYFSLADEAAGKPVRQLALEGPAEALTETDVAQPALFALSLAVLEAARDAGLRASFVAGHSLGEYTAAVASGALSLEEGMPLVCERGRRMAAAQSERPGSMAAVIGLDADALSELCAGVSSEVGLVALANLNTPTQLVVSGESDAVARVAELARAAGAGRVIPLEVGAAFHSALMEPVQAALAERMSRLDWQDPEVPLASNASGALVTTGEDVKGALVAQVASPVRWVECIRALADAGATTFLELGSGRVLAGLVRQILGPDADTAYADSPKRLDEFVSAHADG